MRKLVNIVSTGAVFAMGMVVVLEFGQADRLWNSIFLSVLAIGLFSAVYHSLLQDIEELIDKRA